MIRKCGYKIQGGYIVTGSRRLLLMSVALFVVVMFSPLMAGSTENVPAEAPPAAERIDRTDFPVLYLTSPHLQGDAVWMVQARLRELGYDIEPDGIFNQNTSDLISIFQLANRLEVNGTVTREVWEKLMDYTVDQACITTTNTASSVRIVIDIGQHRLTVYDGDQIIKQFPVGVGKSSTPSPLGEWKVTQKSINWGNGFGSRWMRLSVPWGIFGIHGTDKPYSVGQSLSHGCIRMRNKDVEALYPLVSVGTPVKIVEYGQIFPKNFKGRTLQIKAYGQDVVYLQNRLKEKGIVFDNADGRFGNMTELAVKYYQIWHGLAPTGKADTETYRSLEMIK